MNEKGFVERKDADWRRLTELCDRADRNFRSMRTEEIQEFVRLYRVVSADLALVRTKSTNPGLTEHLNDLVARCYGILYQAPKKSLLQIILGSLETAAQTVRRRKWFVATAIGLFLTGVFGAYILMVTTPEIRPLFIPAGFESSFDMWKSGKFPSRDANDSFGGWGMYASNNPKVSILTGAVGAGTFGLLSIFIVLTNGAMMGVLAHEVAPLGHLDFLLSSVCPHGVPELSGLFLSGAAGLLLGYALVNPGRRTRGEALREVGPDAITLLGASIALDLIAAPIEGFFSYNPAVPGWLKVSLATVSAAGWLAFWLTYGKSKEEELAKTLRNENR